MTYTVSSGTLNSSIPYHTIPLCVCVCLSVNKVTAVDVYDMDMIFYTARLQALNNSVGY